MTERNVTAECRLVPRYLDRHDFIQFYMLCHGDEPIRVGDPRYRIHGLEVWKQEEA